MIYTQPITRGLFMPRSPLGRPGCAGPNTPRLAPAFTLFTVLTSGRTGPPAGRHRPGRTIANTVAELRQKCGLGAWVRPTDFVRPEPAPGTRAVTA